MQAAAGPKARFFTGHLADFREDRLGFFVRCAREHGDVVRLRILHRRLLLLSHPDLIEEVLVTKSRHFIKHFGLRVYKPILGNGLVTAEGDLWRRQRKLSAPAFQGSRLAGYADAMVECTGRLLGEWRGGQSRDVHADMMALTLEIACKTLFGADDPPDAETVGRALHESMVLLGKRIRRIVPMPEWMPTPDNLRLRRSMGTLNRILEGILQARRAAHSAEGSDLLSTLLAAQDEDGAAMTDRQLFDEAMTLLLAGHETTALALSYCLYLMAMHPKLQEKLHEELGSVLANRSPNYADLPKLQYTRRVVTESMRLYPPADVIGREAISDCTIGEVPVRRGTTIFMSQWAMHRDPRYFPDPETFDPDRWTPEFEKALPRFAYFPFGGGPRYCIGQTFATTEAVLILAALCQRFGFSPGPELRFELWPNITVRPRFGVQLTLHGR